MRMDEEMRIFLKEMTKNGNGNRKPEQGGKGKGKEKKGPRHACIGGFGIDIGIGIWTLGIGRVN